MKRVWMQLGALCLSWLPLIAAGSLEAAEPEKVWIFFADKPDGRGERLGWLDAGVRRSGDELGLPVDPDYVVRLQQAGIVLQFCSRWLNAVSVRATAAQLRWLGTQSWVHRVQPVRGFRRPEPAPADAVEAGSAKGAMAPDYGDAFAQLDQIQVIALHNLGYYGEGVRVALLDNGFHYLHSAFAELRVVAERDFVNGDDVVLDEGDQPVTGDETRSTQNIHGAQVLSLLAGYEPGRFMGAAPRAEYILAKTEDNAVELPIEEDRWIAGLEWADSLGADVVNSSLGYNLWDDGSGYTYEQLDGVTALTTLAAEAAVRRGMVVVAAAGNEGDNSWRYVTAPADGPDVISVGAVNIPAADGLLPALAASSSRGPTADGRIKPDVVAPGQGVVVANIRGGDYVPSSGTSFAAPLVSGVCALLLQAHPDWGPAAVQEALRRTATDLGDTGPDNDYGWGQVDALRASGLRALVPGEIAVGDPFPNPAPGNVVYFPLQLTDRDEVGLRIFNLAGELIFARDWALVAGDYTRPERALRWEIAAGKEKIANGLFFYKLAASSFTRSGRIALTRRDP